MSKLLISSLLLIAMLSMSHADIPVHCLKHQIVGLWIANVTEPTVTNDVHVASCGHKQPDSPKNSKYAGLDDFEPVRTVKFLLYQNSTSVKIDGDRNTTGTWTLIYDEGFDIVFGNERYTNFFYYYKEDENDEKYLSNCGKTIVGWYSNNKSQRACWRGRKILAKGEREEDLIGRQTEQKYVVQPSYLRNANAASFLQEQASASNFKKKRHSLRANKPLDVNSTHIKNGVKYHQNFTNHSEIVDRLNRIENKSWTAKVYPHFESKSLGELNKMAGRKSANKIRAASLSNFAMEDVSDLPKEFDWESSLGVFKNQLQCGSCYVVATMQMVEARLKIKYNESVTLSPQHALDCSYYTQGCGGGYPYLTELFASQYELVPESCSPYLAKDGQCGTCDVSKLDKVYKTTSFKFVGGSYGNCSMRQMMVELMANGPVVASFEPTTEFMYYNGGIFHSVDAQWITNSEGKPEWEKVDHSVLLYGWGETEHGLKYWKLRNSWGPVWGENGNFRMKRGVDESAIESLAEAADPIIVYRNKLE